MRRLLAITTPVISVLIFGICATLIFLSPAQAVYDSKKVNDWKFHLFICKNAIMGLTSLIPLEKKYGREAVKQISEQLVETTVEVILKEEKEYPFDKTDAEMIADLTFAIRAGLEEGNIPLSHRTALNSG